jgi:hypothetical protein
LTVQLISRLAENRHASELIPAVEALERVGHPWLVSVNIAQDADMGLTTGRTEFRRAVQQRLNYHLNGIHASLYSLVLELTDGGRWHLHGVVVYPEDRVVELTRALKGFAGPSPSRAAKSHLVKVTPVDNAKSFQGEFGIRGWAMYMGKSFSRSSKALNGGSPLFASGATRALIDGKVSEAKAPMPAIEADREPEPDTRRPEDNPNWGIF